jgi:HEPN domain-containing protein
MTETAQEWQRKAEADFRTARRELAAPDEPNYDAVCFHAQQGAEKLLKTLLISRSITPPRSHDLVHLCRLLVEIELSWSWPHEELYLLTRGAIDYRYPGDAATSDEAHEILDVAERLRSSLLLLIEG